MQFSENILVQLAIFILGLCGFMVARHIYKHKDNEKKPLVCPVGFDCNAVVHSDYSKIFGIHLEIFGMIYYAFISLSYLLFIFMPSVPDIFGFDPAGALVIVSSIAFLFSIYLIWVQAFVIKKGCSWCMGSAIISFLIFLLTMTNYDFSFIVHFLSR